ncbi:DNA-3-methyladenine glycosylase I [Microbacteriaceae bacterium SG_E_30_P1]|uniref:DNA-3-methyladenine glycosylase I n=1 Tax=Antiquaquibacter oligotrophicus TaxID=2880260 RepID=A0ABT6KKN8_9MICO|nr:DNA-3-methyladenine glycosylase I [Antiquaquibacter oligotrophicus]MDH6180562.1 DNA-3-methyladenine glycosylase I [Antiquaquibacter oligotrophicus]UDF13705.1 DNA-3-methyladenine glycosylase I [Antiquaquibacter oligotrophicus]
MSGVTVGADGISRCAWAGNDSEYLRYHDEEWGYPLHGDRPLFEKISLEAFQAGLSWITILKRRDGFRAAFDGFDAAIVAGYGEDDIARLMANERIIRNRAKILATIGNARATRRLAEEGDNALDELIWSFAPPERAKRPSSLAEIPAVTAESTALSAELRARGFRFVGPTTMYALMQSAGLVDDHVVGCFRAR